VLTTSNFSEAQPDVQPFKPPFPSGLAIRDSDENVRLDVSVTRGAINQVVQNLDLLPSFSRDSMWILRVGHCHQLDPTDHRV
jgi:hypothetical protein